MKAYDVKCPYCGKLNHAVFLEETKGWMECIYCNTTSHTADADEKPDMVVKVIPVLHMVLSS